MRTIMMFSMTLTVVLFTVVAPVNSQPTLVQDGAFIDNRPSGDILGADGLNLFVFVTVTDSGGLSALTGPGSSELSIVES